MAKMKYWNGTQWVPLDAANADTLEGLTVSQIRAGTTKTEVGLGNVDNVKQASKAEFDAHKSDIAPHPGDYTHTITNTYTNGLITQVDETVSGVLRKRWTYSYDANGNLTSVNTKIYASDGVTILKQFTDTYSYTAGEITSVQRRVV